MLDQVLDQMAEGVRLKRKTTPASRFPRAFQMRLEERSEPSGKNRTLNADKASSVEGSLEDVRPMLDQNLSIAG